MVLLGIEPVLAEVSYTVRPGDTLFTIAENFSVPLNTLLTYNHIGNPDRITPGQILRIPGVGEEPAATEPATAPQPAAQPNPAGTNQSASQPAVAKPEPPVVKPAPVAPPAPQPTPPAPKATPRARRSAQRVEPPPSRQFTGRELLEARAAMVEERQAGQKPNVVLAAQALTGTRYRWGGLSSRGIDCSGLVVRAMLADGKHVPHHAATLSRMGKAVAYKDLQPGDLVFFATAGGSRVSHVGIWVGNNHFLHASCSHGVVEEELTGYYARRLVGARRL